MLVHKDLGSKSLKLVTDKSLLKASIVLAWESYRKSYFKKKKEQNATVQELSKPNYFLNKYMEAI